MFIGATALSLGNQILMRWVATDPDVVLTESEGRPDLEPMEAPA